MLYVPNTTSATAGIRPPITGRYLSHNRLNARARARLAADVLSGRIPIDASTLTVGQVVRLCRTNKTYLNEIRFPDRVRDSQQKKLAAVFDAIGPDARAEACRTIGIERVWAALTAAL